MGNVKVFLVKPVQELLCHPQDKRFLDAKNFSGCPFPGKWKRVELFPKSGAGKKADFYGFGGKTLACSQRVMLECGPLEDEGEFLPVRIRGIAGRYCLYNVTNCCSHLDVARTTWNPDVAKGEPGAIRSPAFHPDRLPGDCVFKIPEDGATAIYCPEWTGRPDDDEGEFKALVEHNRLTGLEFELVWSSVRKGVAPPRP